LYHNFRLERAFTTQYNNFMEKKRFGIDINSPFILWLTGLALVLLVIDLITGGFMRSLFAVRKTSFADPMQYVRLVSYVLVHANPAHYVGNFMMILAIGPMVEEKYGSERIFLAAVITTLITGLGSVIFFPNVVMVGASGIVFMLILLASFTNMRQGRFPITVLLVAALYLGNEIFQGLFSPDNISRIGHIAGGLCGAVFGLLFHSNKN